MQLKLAASGCIWLVVPFHTGGKKKPLKQPKKAQADLDDVSIMLSSD